HGSPPKSPNCHPCSRTQASEAASDPPVAHDSHAFPRELRSQRVALEPTVPLVSRDQFGDPAAQHHHCCECVFGNRGCVCACSARDQDLTFEQPFRNEFLDTY